MKRILTAAVAVVLMTAASGAMAHDGGQQWSGHRPSFNQDRGHDWRHDTRGDRGDWWRFHNRHDRGYHRGWNWRHHGWEQRDFRRHDWRGHDGRDWGNHDDDHHDWDHDGRRH